MSVALGVSPGLHIFRPAGAKPYPEPTLSMVIRKRVFRQMSCMYVQLPSNLCFWQDKICKQQL